MAAEVVKEDDGDARGPLCYLVRLPVVASAPHILHGTQKVQMRCTR